MKPKESDKINDFNILFTDALLDWNRLKNSRPMPWKGEKNPYKIWLSEIILQQTRVEQGLDYYKRFINTFPTIQQLAQAQDQQVFKLWEGLGYYSRCKNLLETARYITEKLNGIFPRQYNDILQLKGIGSYTAAAIASFAYNQPFAVLDGNVFRVLARIYNIETPIDTTIGKKQFAQLAHLQLSKEQPGIYNQAIMDFGAIVCKPHPECSACFFTKHCKAFAAGRQLSLPVKEKKIVIKDRWLNYMILQYKDQIAIRQRTARDIWQNLHEFPLVETELKVSNENLQQLFCEKFCLNRKKILFQEKFFETKQRLTHRQIHFSFVRAEAHEIKDIPGFIWVKQEQMKCYSFPKIFQKLL